MLFKYAACQRYGRTCIIQVIEGNRSYLLEMFGAFVPINWLPKNALYRQEMCYMHCSALLRASAQIQKCLHGKQLKRLHPSRFFVFQPCPGPRHTAEHHSVIPAASPSQTGEGGTERLRNLFNSSSALQNQLKSTSSQSEWVWGKG